MKKFIRERVVARGLFVFPDGVGKGLEPKRELAQKGFGLNAGLQLPLVAVLDMAYEWTKQQEMLRAKVRLESGQEDPRKASFDIVKARIEGLDQMTKGLDEVRSLYAELNFARILLDDLLADHRRRGSAGGVGASTAAVLESLLETDIETLLEWTNMTRHKIS